MVTDRDPEGLFHPDDRCPVTGRQIIDVLQDKHPEVIVPAEGDFDQYPDAADRLESVPIYCYEEQVAKAAARLSGGASPCGVEGTMLRSWLLQHETHSEKLREELARWVCWLSNGSSPASPFSSTLLS